MEITFEERLERLVEASLNGKDPGREELAWVLKLPDELTLALVSAVSRVRFAAFGRRVKLNLLLNIKSGLCPEDCHYCSQSRDSTAAISSYSMVEEDTFCAAAERARELGATRLCLVASGRGPTDREVAQVARGVEAVKAGDGALEICACLGLLSDGQADQLGKAGVYAYNHNLNTSESFYDAICDTHTFADRQETVERAREGGLSPCSGALFGMGESDADVLDAGYALKAIEPDSVPINFLIPIEGTPFAGVNQLTPQRCLRILAVFRLLFPRSEVRIAGGREVHLRSLQPLGLYLANSIFIGDYLTTKGQAAAADLAMIADAGLEIEGGGRLQKQDSKLAAVELKQGVLD
ncbi:MAG: biotin synthase BioB [Dehalococcoidia bacterium]|nr:biotin synthase BioB [Dehalococcoidia bacterium]HCV00439.1 biotin synthase BioB [Dehalococcoidia bacterium]|tara:strand:- start:1166 stop:2221 length:1056 start_codon:yes stop_codon:yes gene_type:complete